MSDKTPTETLRAAAVRLRQVAGAATPGPWQHVNREPCGSTIEYAVVKAGDWLVADCGATEGEDRAAADASYIATMHPDVALRLAAWLDVEADVHDVAGCEVCRHALNVARAVLGEA